jgi:hypothetical protein
MTTPYLHTLECEAGSVGMPTRDWQAFLIGKSL